MADKLDLVLQQYDRALYSEYGRGVIIVQKDGLYGVINKDGEEIIPCKYEEYSDVWHEWKDMGFTTKKTEIITPEQKAVEERKLALEAKREELAEQGHINRLSFYNGRTVNGTAFVKLPNGQIGIAASVIAYDSERDKNLEILDENGEHLMFISEPELLKGVGTPNLVISSDEENLYVGSYGNEFSYLAAYTMGDFERKWKTPMNGSRIQSIAVNETQVIAYDMEDGKIKYFDKTTGEHIDGKDIDTKKSQDVWTITSQHNLATTNERLIAAVPGLEFGIGLGTLEFNNELKVFDNERAQQVASTSFSAAMGSLNGVAVDAENGRAFLAIGNKIGIFDSNGYIGMIPQTTRNITQLDFDSQTGCLMVSMKEGKGKVEILDSEAIRVMAETSSRLLRGDVSTEKLGKETLDVQDQTPYIDETVEGIGRTKLIDEQSKSTEEL